MGVFCGTTNHGGASGLGVVFRLVRSGQPFIDDVLTAGTTPIRAVHILELRRRIDALRVRFGLAAFLWFDPSLVATSTPIKARHITDLRLALSEAYSAAGLTLPTYTTDPTLAAGTMMKAAHITEIRAAVVAME